MAPLPEFFYKNEWKTSTELQTVSAELPTRASKRSALTVTILTIVRFSNKGAP